ncbi:MAG: endo-1,4-beta-xylanase [Myxococcota bacterium]
MRRGAASRPGLSGAGTGRGRGLRAAPTHPESGVQEFADADAVVALAEAHAMRVRGHTLLWASPIRIPDCASAIASPPSTTRWRGRPEPGATLLLAAALGSPLLRPRGAAGSPPRSTRRSPGPRAGAGRSSR